MRREQGEPIHPLLPPGLGSGNFAKLVRERPHWKQLAEEGELNAAYHYAHICFQLSGEGDLEEALTWFRVDYDQGNMRGAFYLGRVYEKIVEYQKARAWYKIAADGGNYEAAVYFGTMCYGGSGGDVDFPNLVKYFKFAHQDPVNQWYTKSWLRQLLQAKISRERHCT